MAKKICLSVALTVIFAAIPTATMAQSKGQLIIKNSTTVFDEIVSLQIQAIPQVMLADAEGVAIIPNLIKGGFVLGARHGKGVLLIRDNEGSWELPVFISLTGGNIGWQIGVQSTDLILVFKTRKSIDGILNGKLTLGADAAAAAGPVGRQAAAATDGRLQAEIYSYSRSRGLFAGVSVDGSVLRVERNLHAAYYAMGETENDYYVPEAAVELVNRVATYCRPTNVYYDGQPIQDESLSGELAAPQMDETGTADDLRRQLANAANGLSEQLDQQWVNYLAIPPEVFRAGPHPSPGAIERSRERLDAVAQDPQYNALSKREAFQRTHSLLSAYGKTLAPPESAMRLPPPPVLNEGEESLRR